MNPNPQLMRFAADLWADLHDPTVVWQLATLALCLGAAYWMARFVRPRLSERVQAHQDDLTRRGASFAQHMHLVGGGFSRILYPLLALVLVLIGRAVLQHFHHVNVLNLAVPLLTAFAAIRALVYLLRHAFAPSGVLAASERWVAIAVWLAVALHFTGMTPELIGAMEQVAFHVGKQRISLWLVFQAVGAEFGQKHQRRRLVQNARVFRCSCEHDVFHLLQFTVVGNGDLNRQPVFARGVRQVLHWRIDQGFVRHNRFGAIERFQHGVARVDMRHRATVFVDGNDVADAN